MTVTCRLITEVVSEAYQVPIRELHSKRRGPKTVRARHVGWMIAKRMTSRSYPEIGRYMGGFDHTTVMRAVHLIGEELVHDEILRREIEALEMSVVMTEKASVQFEHVFEDIDPAAVADRVLNQPLRELSMSLEEMRALVMGVSHYAQQLELLEVQFAEERCAWQAERDHLHAVADTAALHTSSQAGTIVNAAKAVVAARQALQAAETTINERPARKALEASLKTLQTTFERI
jgi:hypothetical protein